ncbi:MAG: SPOR domain-containing protein [Terriglobia bacterium]
MASISSQQGRGFSVRQLTFIFLVLAAVCAIFFALGFLTGANRRSAVATPSAEQVPPPSVIPPPVNAPVDDADSGSAPKSQASDVIEQDLKQPARAAATATSALDAGHGASPATARTEAAHESAPREHRARAAASSRRGLMVQVAALRTEQDARSLLGVLKSRGYRATVVTPQQAHAGDRLYRVQVGPFGDRAAALKTLHKLGGEGFRPFIRE